MGVPTLTDAKVELNLTGTSQDALLQRRLGAARSMVERRTGPLEPLPFTETFTPRSLAVAVAHRPVRSLDAVTAVNGTLGFALADLTFNSQSGVVRRIDGGSLAGGTFELQYTAGLEDCPDTLALAVLIAVRHLWNSQRGNTRRPTDDDSYQSQSGAGYALPWAAIELLGDYDLLQGVA